MLNKIAAIIRKDTILRFEGRSEILFFLVLPIIFTYLLGGGVPGTDGDNRIYVPIVDEDGGERAAAFLSALATSDTIRPELNTRQDAEDMLAGNDVGALLIIPDGFSDGLTAEGILGGGQAELILRTAPNSNVGLAVEQEVGRAVGDIARPLLIARNAVAGIEAVRPLPDAAARDRFFEASLDAARTALAEAPPRVEYTALTAAGDTAVYDQRAQSSAGQLLTWVFIPLLAASGLFAMERAYGTLRRLMVTPSRKSTFMLGTISSQLILALVQMALLVGFGILVMRVPWGREPVALLVILVSFALAGVALGTTMGTFVKTESQASNLSIMIGMSMALLGGAWWPMELFPPALQNIVKVLPTTWAMSALTDITMRGQGLVDILPEAAVLLGFAVLFFAVGVWRFKYE